MGVIGQACLAQKTQPKELWGNGALDEVGALLREIPENRGPGRNCCRKRGPLYPIFVSAENFGTAGWRSPVQNIEAESESDFVGFRSLTIQSEYRTFKNDIIRNFYIPLLENAVLYKRAVGFFSSTALAEISRGVTGLVKNGGRIQLVASPHLSEEDLEAIRKGYELRNQILERALIAAMDPPKDVFEEKRLNLLANLIAEDRLDLKIAFAESNRILGMYHEKMGLMYDPEGNVVAFAGSLNETSTAMVLNYESIDVFCSWTKDLDRVTAKEAAFASIWDNREPGVQILDFPRVREEILARYRKAPMDLTIDKEYLAREAHSGYEIKCLGACVPDEVRLHDYQVQAIDNWEKNGFQGIFDMATGTGKTYTGLGAVARLGMHVNHSLAVVIVCPYQHLVEQWVEDIVKFNISPIIGYSSSRQKDWKSRLENAIRDQKLMVKHHEFFCFVCTNATFASRFVQDQLAKIRGEALLVVDEAHNFGSARLSNLLNDTFRYRLALSATLERHRDEEGTERLFRYFGPKCIEYTLERAITEHKLTPYKYFPVIVNLNEAELQQYGRLSHEISKCVIIDKHGKRKLSDRGERLALQRARLVAAAESKLDKLSEVIEPYRDQNHMLIYCGAASLLKEDADFTDVVEDDVRQIDAVTQLLGNELNMKVSQFTSKEDIEERETLRREFSLGEKLQALIAIKCLDEGVNIPDIKVAFILASTTNPKEYIQRRGRVLRLAPGKGFAEIYDFITVPRPLNEVSSLTAAEVEKDLSLIKKELNRAEEFARLAMNAMIADKVIEEIKNAYALREKWTDFADAY